MTRSLSPLSFDRSQKGDVSDDTFAELPAGTADDSPALPPTQAGAPSEVTAQADDANDVFHAVEVAIEEQGARPASANVTPFPAPSKVTVVGNSSAPLARAETPAEPSVEAAPAEISGDMIEAIENDMASLLASLNRLDDGAPAEAAPAAEDDDWHDGDETAEEPTLALLSELNRMWQADPEVTSSRI